MRDLSVFCALLVDLIERAFRASVRAKLKSILTIEKHALIEDRTNCVPDKSGRSTSAVVSAIKHFHACKVKHTDIFANALGDLTISIISVGVVVAAGQFSSMRPVLVPPVDARNLSSKSNRRGEDAVGDAEDVLTVLDELLRVPGKEELTIVRSIVVISVAKEASVGRMRVPRASIVGLCIAPFRMTSLLSSCAEVCKHVGIIALELTNAAIGPALVGLIARIAELRSRTKTDRDTVDCRAEIVAELRDKGLHKVTVHVKRSTAVEKRHVVNTKRDVLLVDLALAVAIVDVRIAVSNRKNKLRKRNVACVSDIATTLVEGHNNLELQAGFLAELGKVLVGSKVVFLGTGLRKSPPDISHNTLYSTSFDLGKILLELANILKTLLIDKGKRKHKIHRNGTGNKRQTKQ